MAPDTSATAHASEGVAPVRRDPRRGYAQVVAGALLFGLNAPVAKVVLGSGIEPARLTALRCTGAAVGLFAVLVVTDRSRLRVHWRELPALAVLGLTGAALIQLLYFVAIDRLPVGIALLLEFTGPLLAAVYSRVVLRHALARQVWLALGLTLAGLALVAQVWRDAGLDPVGVAAGLGAGACLATFYLLGQRTLERRDPLTVSFWMFVFAAAFWAVAQPWSAFDPSVLTERASLLGVFSGTSVPVWLALGWVVVLGTLVPYGLEVAALQHLAATTSGVVATLEPVVAAAVAWLWLDEVLSATQVLGGALVLVGVAVVQSARAPAPLPVAPPAS
jgi:drug/metabolite transporter (DMT)-like permease